MAPVARHDADAAHGLAKRDKHHSSPRRCNVGKRSLRFIEAVTGPAGVPVGKVLVAGGSAAEGGCGVIRAHQSIGLLAPALDATHHHHHHHHHHYHDCTHYQDAISLQPAPPAYHTNQAGGNGGGSDPDAPLKPQPPTSVLPG